MQYSTLPFTLPWSDEPYRIDVGNLYAHAQTLIDRCNARRRRYPLALIVTLAVLAKLARYSRVEDVADCAKLRQQEVQLLFATKRAHMPHHTTWCRILGQAVDVAEVEHLAQQVVAPPMTVGEIPDRWSIEVALDGKTIRGT